MEASEQGQGALASHLPLPRLNPTSLTLRRRQCTVRAPPSKLRIIKSTVKYMGNGYTEFVLCICKCPDKCKGLTIRSVYTCGKEKVLIRSDV